MTYLSLFSGIGGFERGIGRKAQCIGYSEIDPYAISIYRSHFPDHKNYGDVTKIRPEDLPAFDLLVGGFPCQAFSIAGKRQGFNDSRGNLFFEIARIVEHCRPRFLLLENVKGLLSHDEGKTFATVISTLDELGYDLQWQVCDSKDFGLAQNRQRVYIVGNIRGTYRSEVFPIRETRAKDIVQGTPVIAVREATLKGYALAALGDGVDVSFPNSRFRRGRVAKGLSHTLTTKGEIHTPTSDGKLRRLTPLECERLQGFPDGWTAMGVDANGDRVRISDNQRYKCLGNGVSVTVVRTIAEKLIQNEYMG
ncbi:MAG: DNA (cytosine-5-)-methyltransferase [Bacteroidetes bacterium]|nr:DNA (cytosine-5-)-methyltransferase [Bacteroidota bacterium]